VFRREVNMLTLPDVRERLDEVAGGRPVSARSSEIAVDLTSDHPSIRVGAIETPVTDTALNALANRMDIPKVFWDSKQLKAMPDLRQTLLSEMLRRYKTDEVHTVVVHEERGITEIRAQSAKVLDPRRLVDVAERVISPEAQVLNYFREAGKEFRLDVLVPQDFDRGIGGDRRVGDLTHAGLRFSQDLRSTDQFHAPEASLLMYRLVCTNGMERMVEDRRGVDARNKSVEEVLMEFEALADRLFRSAEAEIETFYNMRNERVDDPTQAVIRVATEAGLPARIARDLSLRVPGMERANEEFVSMFDVTNLVTNAANDPALTRESGRRALERIGGRMIHDHADRCRTCASRLN